MKDNIQRISISVAICTCNGEKYIEQQLTSIFEQTMQPDEMVICDDMSDDQTCEIIQQAICENANINIRLYMNESRLGVAQNFIKSMGLCSGDVVFFCDQDDVWMCDRVELYMEAFRRNESVKAVLSDAVLTDEDLKPLGKTLWESLGFSHKMRCRLLAGKAHKVLGKQPFVTGAVLAVRKADFSNIHIPQGNRMLHDEWLGWLINNDFAFLNQPTIYYRQHVVQQVGAHYFEGMGDHVRYIGEIMKTQEEDRFPQAEDFEELKQVLSNAGVCASVIACIDGKIRFIRYRQRFPQSRLKRMIYILAKGLPGYKYALYSNGIKGIIKDIIRKVD